MSFTIFTLFPTFLCVSALITTLPAFASSPNHAPLASRNTNLTPIVLIDKANPQRNSKVNKTGRPMGNRSAKRIILPLFRTPAYSMANKIHGKHDAKANVFYMDGGTVKKHFYSPFTGIYNPAARPLTYSASEIRHENPAQSLKGMSASFPILSAGPRKTTINEAPGLAFDYSEQHPNTSFNQREMAASYVVDLNKHWKTKTFIAKGMSNVGSEWRGGLVLGYDY